MPTPNAKGGATPMQPEPTTPPPVEEFDTELECRGLKRVLLNNPEDNRDWRPCYQRANGLANPYANSPTNSNNSPQVVAPGITSDDTKPPTSPDIPAQPQVVNVPPQPKSADVPAQPRESEQAKRYRLETGDNTPIIYTSSEGIYLT